MTDLIKFAHATSRHLSGMGVRRHPVVSEEELNQTIRQALMEIGLGLVGPQWVEAAKPSA